MIYRAQVRNSQLRGTTAQKVLTRQLLRQQSSCADLNGAIPSTPEIRSPSSPVSKTPKTVLSNSKTNSQDQTIRRNVRKKKVSTDTLFAVVIFYEFLRELSSISEEQSIMHSVLYLPKLIHS